MTTTAHELTPAPRWRDDGLPLVAALAAAKLVLHLVFTGRFGYGFFVDELYFLACSRHLDWGFADMPPLFPALTALVTRVLGESLLAVRLVPALAGAALVLLTGALAREMGGGRRAQGLAALAVVVAPIFLVMHSLHTMNALDPLLWMSAALVFLRIANGAGERLWLLFGAICGVGLLNKHSMVFFGSSFAIGLLLSPARRALVRPWIWLGGALAFLIALPNLAWEISHGFPHLTQLENIRRNGRDVALGPPEFLLQQVLMLLPLTAPLWIGGLWWLLRGRDAARYRALGFGFLALILEMLLADGRVYYPAPYYPVLLAAGGVLVERWKRRKSVLPAWSAAMVAFGALLAPLALPCLPPETYVAYTRALRISPPPIETHRLGPLPQLLADRFGWPEMAREVARVYHGLPPHERAVAAIFGQNYGQAGAIDLFGPALGLPACLSGHLAYHDWGPRGFTGEVAIVLDDDKETLERYFEDVRLAGRVEHPYSMPYEHFDVFVCRRPRVTLASLWPDLRKLD
jgi:hypothetical protein